MKYKDRIPCTKCCFWRPFGEHGVEGDCRKHAPRTMPGWNPPDSVDWPVTLEDDWCGEAELEEDLA